MGLKVITLSRRAIFKGVTPLARRSPKVTENRSTVSRKGDRDGTAFMQAGQSCILPGGGRMKVCPETSQNCTHTHTNTQKTARKRVKPKQGLCLVLLYQGQFPGFHEALSLWKIRH